MEGGKQMNRQDEPEGKAKKDKAGIAKQLRQSKPAQPPVSEQQRRVGLIRQLMIANKARGNPRDFVVITHAKQILDVSGVYELKTRLPDDLEPGSHVWVRGVRNDREIVAAAIVIEDHVIREDKEHVMIRDEPRTKEWLLPREDIHPLPLMMNPMLIHKKRLDFYLGERWADVFWNGKLKRRRSKPRARLIRKIN
jgi:hypothetical protein